MIETIYFSSRNWTYGLLALILGLGIFFMILLSKWLFTLKRFSPKGNFRMSTLLTFWPIPMAVLSMAVLIIWMGFFFCYNHFYSLQIGSGKEIVAEYLWPKGKVSIPGSEIASVSVIQKGFGSRASDVLVITTKNGKKLQSFAPVPEPEVLPDRIRETLDKLTWGDEQKE